MHCLHSLTEREAENKWVACVGCFFFFNLLTDELVVPVYKVAFRICADGQASPSCLFLVGKIEIKENVLQNTSAERSVFIPTA